MKTQLRKPTGHKATKAAQTREGRFASVEELAAFKNDRLMKLLEGVDLTTLFDDEKPVEKEK